VFQEDFFEKGLFEEGKSPKPCVGSESCYPEELNGLSPVEERPITLQASLGYMINQLPETHQDANFTDNLHKDSFPRIFSRPFS
jgi:hypothetical protein